MPEDLDKQLERLAERPDALSEDDPLPRGALPALFRALLAADASAQVAGLEGLAARLGDRPLVGPTLQLALEAGQQEAFVAGVRAADGRGAWCSERQVAALADVGPADWLCRALQLLCSDPQGDPTDLALEVDVGAFCAALREVIRLRLGTPARRRCRTSADLARGALRALVRVAPDDAEVQAAARAVLAAETRRAGKGEPALALEALDALDRSPPLACIRLLHPLLGGLVRRKIETRARAVSDGAIARAGVSTDEVALLTARTGDAEPDGGVRVPLEEGGETILRVGADGSIVREGDPPEREDERALQSAERLLAGEWEELARRLERALVDRRGWSVPLWRAIFTAHPLLADLAGRLVWELRANHTRTPFAWDGAPVDLFGDALELPDDARVGLAHPMLFDPDELELWRERALDGGRCAPFPQVFRDVAAPGDDPWSRFTGREAYTDEVEAMARASGWDGCPFMGSPPWELRRTFATDGVTVRVRFDESKTSWRPTLAQRKAAHRQSAKDGEKPRLTRPKEDRPRLKIAFADAQEDAQADTQADALTDASVAMSEAIRDLERLTDPLATVSGLFLRTWQQRKWKDPAEAWKEVVLRYRLGSSALCEVRRVLIAAFAQRLGLTVRLEDRFAILDQWVVELGTGLCHEGPAKDHLPTWKADELAAEGNADTQPLTFPFRREAEPQTVEVVERVLGFSRLAAGPEDASAQIL